jgi:chloramphenicol-sensitive protein RarD
MKFFNSGLFNVIAAYFLWGVLPVYWSQLKEIPAEVSLTHRVFWSIVFLGAILYPQARLKTSLHEMVKKKIFIARAIAALFVAINWLTYVWAMGNGYIQESGLGYFISPLLSVALAALVFKEKLTTTQIYGIALVSSGVLLKILVAEELPWIAIILALSWSIYCTLRKAQASEPINSLFQEVILIMPVLMLLFLVMHTDKLFQWHGLWSMFLLVLSGPITALPILMLVKGLKTVRMSSVAIIQFLTPTLNLVVAILTGESFQLNDLYSYLPIWLGVLVFLGVFERSAN